MQQVSASLPLLIPYTLIERSHHMLFMVVVLLSAVIVLSVRVYFSWAYSRELQDQIIRIERVMRASDKSRISACKALEDLISSRCIDMEKHIETYQDINRRERTSNSGRFTATNARIDDLAAKHALMNGRNAKMDKQLESMTGIGCSLCQGDPEHIEGQFKRLHARIDELGKGLILTNVELDKQNDGHIDSELERLRDRIRTLEGNGFDEKGATATLKGLLDGSIDPNAGIAADMNADEVSP